MNDSATLVLVRRGSILNRWQRYAALIDSVETGVFADGDRQAFPVGAGNHCVQIRAGTLPCQKSEPLTVRLAPGDFKELECGHQQPWSKIYLPFIIASAMISMVFLSHPSPFVLSVFNTAIVSALGVYVMILLRKQGVFVFLRERTSTD